MVAWTREMTKNERKVILHERSLGGQDQQIVKIWWAGGEEK